MSGTRTILWGAAAALVLTALCRAQDAVQPADRPAAGGEAPAVEPSGAQPAMLAGFGFGGQWPAERWAPITVFVTAGDQPLSGTIVVEYTQDPTQGARIAVPFAATAQRTTPVPVVACVPNLCDRVVLTMLNERGAPTHRLVYARSAGPTEAELPPQVGPEHGLLVCVGRTTLPESVRDWRARYAPWTGGVQSTGAPVRRSATVEQEEAWTMTAAGRVEPDELPLSWAAFDGVRALVVNPQSSGNGRAADPRSQEAVQTWVRSGGRLVVMADGPGEGWRSWLPEEARSALELDPSESGPLPGEVSAAVRQAASETEARRNQEPENESFRAPVPAPAEAASRRLIRLTDAGRAAGWRLRWTQGADRGLLAEGPAGYGLVTVLGLDPARAPSKASTRATAAVWRSALQSALADWLEEAVRVVRARSGGQWAGWAQAAPERAANVAVERLGQVPVTSEWIFWIIGAAMATLAVLIGPVDYLVLKRLRWGHRSWMTALAWIGLASLVAYGAPRLIRAEPTQVNRLRVIDAIAPRPGPGERLAFSTGFTGIYAAESGTLPILGVDPASWWRGASTSYAWQPRSMGEARGVVPTTQAAAGGRAGSSRGNPLAELPIALWTFRAFRDMSIPGPERWESRLAERVAEGPMGYSVMIAGLPEEAAVTSAVLRVGDRWFTIEAPEAPKPPEAPAPESPPVFRGPVRRMDRDYTVVHESREPVGRVKDGAWSALFPIEHGSRSQPARWSDPPEDAAAAASYAWTDQAGPVNMHPGPLLGLAGPDRRAMAVRERVSSGAFAAVYLELEGVPPDVRVPWASVNRDACVLRVLTPLEGGGP